MTNDKHFTESNVEDLILWLRKKAHASTVDQKAGRLFFAAEIAEYYLERRRESADASLV